MTEVQVFVEYALNGEESTERPEFPILSSQLCASDGIAVAISSLLEDGEDRERWVRNALETMNKYARLTKAQGAELPKCEEDIIKYLRVALNSGNYIQRAACASELISLLLEFGSATFSGGYFGTYYTSRVKLKGSDVEIDWTDPKNSPIFARMAEICVSREYPNSFWVTASRESTLVA